MATHLTLASLFTAIADKIRTKTGSTAAIVADDFPDAIDNILTPADGTIATKTSSDLTTSGATVTVPAGYYASNASKSVTTATQATPSISVNSSGLITASSTQSVGYVTAGTKKATKQLTTQAAKTVTPTRNSQIAVSSGAFTTGNIMVAGDSYLAAPNIKSGVSIFGVPGSYTSDATATTSDIINGKTAYVNGTKVTGTMETLSDWSTVNTTPINYSDSYIELTNTVSKEGYIPSGTKIVNKVSAFNFGDATAADVAAGKTFTSAAGLNVTGTGSFSQPTYTVTIYNECNKNMRVLYRSAASGNPLRGTINDGEYETIRTKESFCIRDYYDDIYEVSCDEGIADYIYYNGVYFFIPSADATITLLPE